MKPPHDGVYRHVVLLVCIALLLLFQVSTSSSAAQEKTSSTAQTIDWRSLTPQIQAALGTEFTSCYQERRWIDIVQTADEGGVPEALVEYCHMGAYTSNVALVRLENGNPVIAQFRDKDRKVIQTAFLNGASVRNGFNTKLLPDKNAVYMISWHTDDSGQLESCGAQAYLWNRETRTFDANQMLGNEITKRECRHIKRELECEEHPCPTEPRK